jgi:hypothetical protein
MANKDSNVLLFVAIGALAYVLIFGMPDFGGKKDTTLETPQMEDAGGCALEKVTFSPKMTRLGKAGTVLTTGQNYYILTDKIGTVAGGVTTDIATNKAVSVMFGENSTTYYTKIVEVNTGCENPKYVNVELALAGNPGLTTTDTNGQPNLVGTPEPIAADEIFEATVKMKQPVDTVFGNPDSTCANIAIVEYDKDLFTEVKGNGASTGQPTWFTESDANNTQATAFEIPKLASGKQDTFVVSFTAKVNIASSDDMPIIHVYGCDIDKNEDTLAAIQGITDEDGNAIYIGTSTETIFFS